MFSRSPLRLDRSDFLRLTRPSLALPLKQSAVAYHRSLFQNQNLCLGFCFFLFVFLTNGSMLFYLLKQWNYWIVIVGVTTKKCNFQLNWIKKGKTRQTELQLIKVIRLCLNRCCIGQSSHINCVKHVVTALKSPLCAFLFHRGWHSAKSVHVQTFSFCWARLARTSTKSRCSYIIIFPSRHRRCIRVIHHKAPHCSSV